MAAKILHLPLVDLAAADRAAAAVSIRKACVDHGFFYLTNHGIPSDLLVRVFAESRKFFVGLPAEEKLRLLRNARHRGYTPPYAERLDTSSPFNGDLKESFYIGPTGSDTGEEDVNQWPSKECLPLWRLTMEEYYKAILHVGKRLLSLIALALNLDEHFFEKIGAIDHPEAFLRLLHYPGEVSEVDDGNYGASAHTDYGMITLLATDGVPGLQICREKEMRPQIWENVPHVDGVLIVNIGDLLERWTNCFFRSTLHRVMAIGQERFSVAFFVDPHPDCVVECLDSCSSQEDPPRYPPVKAGDYLQERLRATYGS